MRPQHPALKDEQYLRNLNTPPPEPYQHTHENWSAKNKSEVMREIARYQEWLKSIQPGDAVYYRYYSHYSNAHMITKVKTRTKTGMIRLEDGKLVDPSGKVKGEYSYLMPFTEVYVQYQKRKRLLYEINTMKFEHFTDEGLMLITNAILQAEALLPQMLESGIE